MLQYPVVTAQWVDDNGIQSCWHSPTKPRSHIVSPSRTDVINSLVAVHFTTRFSLKVVLRWQTTTSLSRQLEMTKQYGAYKHKFRSRILVFILVIKSNATPLGQSWNRGQTWWANEIWPFFFKKKKKEEEEEEEEKRNGWLMTYMYIGYLMWIILPVKNLLGFGKDYFDLSIYQLELYVWTKIS